MLSRIALSIPTRRPIGLLLLALLVNWPSLNPARGEGPPRPPETTAEQRQSQEKRNRLEKRAQELRAQGKLDAAVAAVEAMLALDREVLGEAHADVARSLELLAELHEERDNWTAALAARREVLALRTKALGEGHWRAIDARWALSRDLSVAACDDRTASEVYCGGKV